MIEAKIELALTTYFNSSPSDYAAIVVKPMVIFNRINPPFIVYTIGSVDPEWTLEGRNQLTNTSIAIDVVAPSYLEAKQLTHHVLAAMETAPLSDFDIGAYTVSEDMFDVETHLYTISSNFSLWHYMPFIVQG